MLRQKLFDLHYPIYQSVIAIIGAMLVIRLLLDFSWGMAAAAGTITVIAYWLGQGIVTLLQRSGQRSSLD